MMSQESPAPLSPQTIQLLKDAFGETAVSTFEGYTIPQMVKFIGGDTLSKAPSIPGKPAVARALLSYMRENEFIDTPAATPVQAPVIPASIKLERDKTYAEMGMKELLENLRDNPDDFEEIMDALRQQPLVAQIERSRPGVAWAIPTIGDSNKLDVEATIEYLRFLKNSAATPQESFLDRIPQLLRTLLRRKPVTVFHPVTGQPSAMLDENGHDLSGIHPDLWKACIFAGRTGYKAWQGVDPYAMTEELVNLGGKLPQDGRLKRVYIAYQRAIQDEDPQALGIVINVPERPHHRSRTETARSSVSVVVVQPELSEEDCRQRLYGGANAPVGNHNRGASLGREIVESARSHNGDFHFDRTILLEGGYTHNGRLSGVVFVPRRFNVSSHNGNTSGLRVERKSYRQLLEIALSSNEYGLD